VPHHDIGNDEWKNVPPTTGDQYDAAIEAQEALMNPVVHFEMPAIDRKRIADFYSRAFGRRTQVLR
jgi:hypothetical protein